MNPYDELYHRYNMALKPYGYSSNYVLWRNRQIKMPFVQYMSNRERVLDVGGGFGILGTFLPERNRDNYFNLDVSSEMLKYSPFRNIIGAGECLPFKDSTFDCVVCSEVLEHVNDKEKTLAECYRVLKPNSIFCLSTPRTGWGLDFWNNYMFATIMRINAVFATAQATTPDPAGVKEEPSDERWLKQAVKKSGFHILSQYRADNHVPWGTSKFWMLFADMFVKPEAYGHCTVLICLK